MSLYNLVAGRFPSWPLPASPNRLDPAATVHTAYYLWRFPALSETVIQREVRALREAGLRLAIFADAPADQALWDAGARSLAATTKYLLPLDRSRLRMLQRRFLRRHPRMFLDLLLYTVFQPYSAYRSLSEDLNLFHKAVYLAGCLEEQSVTHIHSPWANISAFLALLASRLAGIPYSVQARASSDLYRTTARYGLKERFGHASFIVTNARFNQAFIRSYLPATSPPPIHVIYEGLELAQFTPTASQAAPSGPIRLLTVARLIEEKGLLYLLQALKSLQEDGRVFQAEIIGAADDPNYGRELRSLRDELGLQTLVSFPGALPFDQVLQRYAAADIFVLPCVVAGSGGRDVTPNALIEAMAMRLAVVSTNITGIPELVEHGVSGLLVPPRNAPALALALGRLLDDPALRRSLAEKARQRVETRFDLAQNIQSYLALFDGR